MNSAHISKQATKLAWLMTPLGVLFAFLLVEIQHVTDNFAIGNLDYFPLVDRAVNLGLSSWDGWVSWQHPNGFPWLIRIGLELGFDAARFGQALSIFGGILGLIGTYLIARSVQDDPKFALVCQAFVATTGFFLFYSSFEGNDMLAAGFQVLSIGALAIGLARSSGESSIRMRWLALASMTTGLGYLIRYTGMITAMASLLVLVSLALYHRSRTMWKAIGVYVVIFVFVTTVQWLPSLIVTGSPLANDQGKNLWYHVYGKSDFLTQWNEVGSNISVWQVIEMNPGKVLRHWWRNFQSFWFLPTMTILEVPLKLFTQAGIVFLLIMGKAIRPAIRALLSLYVLLHLAALSLMRLDPRFLVLLIPALVVGVVYFFSHILPSRWRLRQVDIPIKVLITVVGLLFAIQIPLDFASDKPQVSPTWIEASDTLHAAGMQHSQEVLSTDLQLQDLAALDRRRFGQAFVLAPEQSSLVSLIQTARIQGVRFLIYDRDAGPRLYPDLGILLSPEARPADLTPIYIEQERDFVIYRIEQEDASTSPPIALFDQGISLQQYQLNLNRPDSSVSDLDIGVYLYWQAERTPTSSFKVFIHILDESGQLVAQDDSIPSLWTYPTLRWASGETVVDFHRVRIVGTTPDATYMLQVGLYDEATGVRLGRFDDTGKIVDDKIILQSINR